MTLLSTNHRLLVAISSHGYGHATQTSVVVNALRQVQPNINLILYTALPRSYLETRFNPPFEHVAAKCDIGMVMDSAIDVRVDASAEAYARFHEHWDLRIDKLIGQLKELKPDLVLANIPYAILYAATQLGLPAIAACSLNWADIYLHYCRHRPETELIHQQILSAYHSANVFLRFSPGMPMRDLPNVKPVGPVASLGRDRSQELKQRFNIHTSEQLVLIGMGGVDMPVSAQDWPKLCGTCWFVPKSWGIHREDCLNIENLGVPFIDLIASSDLLITKPGYGSFTEAACNGIPLLYVERGDWPEEPFLTQWLEQHGRCYRISRESFVSGKIDKKLMNAIATAPATRSSPTGIKECVVELSRFLHGNKPWKNT